LNCNTPAGKIFLRATEIRSNRLFVLNWFQIGFLCMLLSYAARKSAIARSWLRAVLEWKQSRAHAGLHERGGMSVSHLLTWP